ncbi:hypothetical protein GLOTRDRAFT_130170 [Gloeophyllum trabeum ATCC 11539]|uniref:Uncharacterized protein n=1 Tax=Gloeophyllum trabeum (strain ATCC 11539 / FP-39264 / Madison 617) TaxID=670483 RepID=S7Q5S0_GLOTA|nr:uncharacterized protein GLOTRDRAFT_130170 [Gloeophyllum trabeum ATCC 11539]EPQ54818.1 hypothetical protein GLOTRDRAFT_130170 [Gloeophyllum trabeum ATCC 11539]
MPNYLYLIWYSPQFGGPRHWGLFIVGSREPEAYGTLYHCITDQKRSYACTFSTDVRYGVAIKGPRSNRTYEDRVLLGTIGDDVKVMMTEYADAATQMVNEHNVTRGRAESNCHDWVLHIVRSLDNSHLIEQGALGRAAACPR